MNKSILVLEENSVIHGLVSSALDVEGVTVHHEFNPGRYVERANALRPDLILAGNVESDPDYRIFRSLKESPGLTEVPVVMLAGSREELNGDLLRDLRVVGLIRKPFEASDLQQQVSKHLNLVDLIGSAYEYRKSQSTRDEGVDPLANLDVLDSEVLSLMQGNGERQAVAAGAAEEAPGAQVAAGAGAGGEASVVDEDALAEALEPERAFEAVEAPGEAPAGTGGAAAEAPEAATLETLEGEFPEEPEPAAPGPLEGEFAEEPEAATLETLEGEFPEAHEAPPAGEEGLHELGAADVLDEESSEETAFAPQVFDQSLEGEEAGTDGGEGAAAGAPLENIEVELGEGEMDFEAIDRQLSEEEVDLFESELEDKTGPAGGEPPEESIPLSVRRMLDLKPVFSLSGERQAAEAAEGDEGLSFEPGEETSWQISDELSEVGEIDLEADAEVLPGEATPEAPEAPPGEAPGSAGAGVEDQDWRLHGEETLGGASLHEAPAEAESGAEPGLEALSVRGDEEAFPAAEGAVEEELGPAPTLEELSAGPSEAPEPMPEPEAAAPAGQAPTGAPAGEAPAGGEVHPGEPALFGGEEAEEFAGLEEAAAEPMRADQEEAEQEGGFFREEYLGDEQLDEEQILRAAETEDVLEATFSEDEDLESIEDIEDIEDVGAGESEEDVIELSQLEGVDEAHPSFEEEVEEIEIDQDEEALIAASLREEEEAARAAPDTVSGDAAGAAPEPEPEEPLIERNFKALDEESVAWPDEEAGSGAEAGPGESPAPEARPATAEEAEQAGYEALDASLLEEVAGEGEGPAEGAAEAGERPAEAAFGATGEALEVPPDEAPSFGEAEGEAPAWPGGEGEEEISIVGTAAEGEAPAWPAERGTEGEGEPFAAAAGESAAGQEEQDEEVSVAFGTSEGEPDPFAASLDEVEAVWQPTAPPGFVAKEHEEFPEEAVRDPFVGPYGEGSEPTRVPRHKPDEWLEDPDSLEPLSPEEEAEAKAEAAAREGEAQASELGEATPEEDFEAMGRAFSETEPEAEPEAESEAVAPEGEATADILAGLHADETGAAPAEAAEAGGLEEVTPEEDFEAMGRAFSEAPAGEAEADTMAGLHAEEAPAEADEGELSFEAAFASLRTEIESRKGESLDDVLHREGLRDRVSAIEFGLPQNESTFARGLGVYTVPGASLEPSAFPAAFRGSGEAPAAPRPAAPEATIPGAPSAALDAASLSLLDSDTRQRLGAVLDEIISISVRKAVQEEMPRLMERLSKEEQDRGT